MRFEYWITTFIAKHNPTCASPAAATVVVVVVVAADWI